MEQEIKQAEEDALALRLSVDQLIVIDQASYDAAQVINRKAYEGRKAFHLWFDPIDTKSREQRQTVIAQGKEIDGPYDYIIDITGRKCAAWMAEEQRKADDVRRKAKAEARKKAEDEQLEKAELLASLGLTDAAEEVIEAEPVPERVYVPEPQRAAGTSLRTYYSAEADLSVLVKAIAEGKAPIQAVIVNQAYLDGRARLEKEALAIPGVKVVKEVKQSRRV